MDSLPAHYKQAYGFSIDRSTGIHIFHLWKS